MCHSSDPTWTREAVCAALVAAFRRPQSAYLATPGEVELALNWRVRVPHLDRQAWRQLLAWARAQAGGESLSSMCAAHGWTRSTADRGWRHAADAIAAALNGEGVNPAAVMAGKQAAQRLEAGPRQAGSPGATTAPDAHVGGGAPTRRLVDRAG